MGIYTKQWIPLNSIAKDVRIAEHERDLLKGLKPATVVEPNNQGDITIIQNIRTETHKHNNAGKLPFSII